MPRKYAVPAGSACSRLLSACAARYTGCAVRERERLDGLDTHPASQTSGRFCYSIDKTRDMRLAQKRTFGDHRPTGRLALRASVGGGKSDKICHSAPFYIIQ